MSESKKFVQIKPPVKEFAITEFPDFGEGGTEYSRLTNGRHNIVKCSNCGAKLCDAWVTEPDVDIHFNIVAHCCVCGDKSFVTPIDGKFHLGIVTDNIHIVNTSIDGKTVSVYTRKN